MTQEQEQLKKEIEELKLMVTNSNNRIGELENFNRLRDFIESKDLKCSILSRVSTGIDFGNEVAMEHGLGRTPRFVFLTAISDPLTVGTCWMTREPDSRYIYTLVFNSGPTLKALCIL